MKKIFNTFISNPLLSGSAMMLIGSNTTNFLNYIYHLVMGRMLGPGGYGELASLISLIGLIGVLPGSVSMVVIKYVSAAKSKQEIDTLVKWMSDKIIKTSIIVFILVLLAAPFINSFLHINKIIYFVLIAVSFLFSLSSGFNRAVLQGLLKFKEMVLSVLVENSAKVIFCVIFVYVGFGVSGALFGFVFSVIAGWYLTKVYISYKGGSYGNFDFKSMMIFTIPVIIQAFSITSLYSSDLILVKHFFSSYEAGLYASLSTVGKIIFFATGPISAVMFPLVSRRFSQGESYRKIFIFSFISTAFFSLLLMSIYWIMPELMIRLLYGSSYLGAADLLVWFGLFMTLFTLSSLLVNFNLSLGRTRVVIFPLVCAIFQVLFIWLYHESLLKVVYISTIATALLLMSLLIYSIYKEKDFS